MKKLLSLIMISVVMSMALTSCAYFQEKVVPKAKMEASKKIVEAIATTGECASVDVIKADVDALLKVESDESIVVQALNDDVPEGAQGEGVVSEICKAAAKLALPALLNQGVPEKWNCALTDLNAKIGELAEQACGKIKS